MTVGPGLWASCRDFASRGFDDFHNVASKLWHCIRELPCNLLLQETVRFCATFQHLVGALHKLDKLSSVDVRVSRAFDIRRDLWRNVDKNARCCIGESYKVLDQYLTELVVSISKRSTSQSTYTSRFMAS